MPLARQEIRTFFVTSITNSRRAIFQSSRMADLLIEVLNDNRKRGRFLLHEFVIMPEHLHLLLTPTESVSLEKAVQYIKGGFSFRARRELDFRAPIWQESFTNHRLRDSADYETHRAYIRENPVKRFLAPVPEVFRYSSAHPESEIDPAPPWLKPLP
jgi:putative transposase